MGDQTGGSTGVDSFGPDSVWLGDSVTVSLCECLAVMVVGCCRTLLNDVKLSEYPLVIHSFWCEQLAGECILFMRLTR